VSSSTETVGCNLLSLLAGGDADLSGDTDL